MVVADVPGTVAQVADLARAGSELVRITVNNEQAARAVPAIREGLDKRGVTVPLVGAVASFVGEVAQALEELLAGRIDTALSLHGFDDDGTDIAIHLLASALDVVELRESHARHERLERVPILRSRSGSKTAEQATVDAAARR